MRIMVLPQTSPAIDWRPMAQTLIPVAKIAARAVAVVALGLAAMLSGTVTGF